MTEAPFIDHIGIAVRDLDEASSTFARILGASESRRERVESEGVEIAVFETGGTRIELLSPLHEHSPIAKFLEKRGPGVHHISLGSRDIRGRHAELGRLGFTFPGGIRKGGEGREVFFLNPKETQGVLIEFTSPPGDGSGD
jgi:methylmalonyl-CoA/ethylmalonyl-CoA epimerase